LTEEAIRKNFILIYEIIDEVLVYFLKIFISSFIKDFGYPQLTSTDQVKKYVVNEAVPVESAL